MILKELVKEIAEIRDAMIVYQAAGIRLDRAAKKVKVVFNLHAVEVATLKASNRELDRLTSRLTGRLVSLKQSEEASRGQIKLLWREVLRVQGRLRELEDL